MTDNPHLKRETHKKKNYYKSKKLSKTEIKRG